MLKRGSIGGGGEMFDATARRAPWALLNPRQRGVLQRRRRDRLRVLHSTNRVGEIVDVLGKQIEVQPGVFSPRYGEGSQLLAEILQSVQGSRALDMCSGSGVLSMMLAARYAHVVAVDCQASAVANCWSNARVQRVDQIVDVRFGWDFDVVGAQETFDLIVCNPPFMCGVPGEAFDVAVLDPAYCTLRRIVDGIARHLAPGGAAYVAFSTVGIERVLLEAVHAVGLHWSLAAVEGSAPSFFVLELRQGPEKA